jgi:hypothetical protein
MMKRSTVLPRQTRDQCKEKNVELTKTKTLAAYPCVASQDHNSELALQTTGRVMQIDFGGDKKLRVNYSGACQPSACWQMAATSCCYWRWWTAVAC